jgi:Zn-dependent peptidase ImmA (M78 family)/transcriptional regulator with XRE-family HTH domain
MDVAALGERIKELRESRGMLASELASRLDVDPTAMSKIENGRRAVKSHEVTVIARALGVSPMALLEPESLVGRLSASTRPPEPTGSAYNELIGLIELHELLKRRGIRSSAKIAGYANPVGFNWREGAERLARDVRTHLGLDSDTIKSDPFTYLAHAIQQHLGVDVVVEPVQNDPLRGATIADIEFPLLFVNADDQTQPKALFTLAHELGHLLARRQPASIVLDYDHDLDADSDDERFANAFAASLLMPAAEVVEFLDGRPGELEPTLILMADQFAVGFETVAYRLRNLGYISAQTFEELRDIPWSKVALDLSTRTHGQLPFLRAANLQARSIDPPPRIAPAILIARAVRGFNSGAISATPLARLLRIDPEELLRQQKRRLDVEARRSYGTLRSGSEAAEDAAEDKFQGVPA